MKRENILSIKRLFNLFKIATYNRLKPAPSIDLRVKLLPNGKALVDQKTDIEGLFPRSLSFDMIRSFEFGVNFAKPDRAIWKFTRNQLNE